MSLDELLRDYALIRKSTLTDIGDAIREQTGSAEYVNPALMGAAVRALTSGDGGDSGGGLINGYKYACGTVSFETDQVSEVYIDHDDVGSRKLILVWCDNPTTESVAYKVLSFFIPTDGTARWKNSGAVYFSTAGDMTFGNTATAAGHGVYEVNSTQFYIGAAQGVGCRMLAGKTYHWLVIGGG